MADYQGNQKNDTFYWLIALGLIFTGVAAPIGVLMIVMKMLSGGKKRGRHPYYDRQNGQGPAGARTAWETPSWESASRTAPSWEEPLSRQGSAKARKKSGRDPLSELDAKGKSWAIAGGATAAGCLLGFIGSLSEPLYWLLNGDFDRDFFLCGDKRSLRSVELHSRKARLLTNHPEGSYCIAGEGSLRLEITNPARFWSTTNFMVIQTD